MSTENYDPYYPDQPVVDQYLPVWAKQPAFGPKPAFIWADDDDTTPSSSYATLTYSDLNAAVQRMSVALLDTVSRGDTVLLLASPGLRLVKLIFACQRAGLVAVPIVPPHPSNLAAHRHLLRAVSQTSPAAAVADASYISALMDSPPAFSSAALKRLRWLPVGLLETIPAGDGGEDDPSPATRTPTARCYKGCAAGEAYLIQYTSGATGEARPVVVTAGAAAHNVRAARKAYGLCPGSVVVSWLPQYHDCGLMFLLLTVVSGATCVLASPAAFLRRPRLWLELVDAFGATCTPVPSFALPLVLRRGGRRSGNVTRPLDLGSLRNLILINEPIYESSVDEFVREFGRAGLDPASISPSYGLAENCTFVSTAWCGTTEPKQLPSYKKLLPSARLPSSSLASSEPEIDIVVVDGQTGEPVEDGVEGEIWVSSPSNASGYLGQPSASREVFCATLPAGTSRTGARFVRTGDCGVVVRGGTERYLYVLGRNSDAIFIATDDGQRRVHAHYIETAAFGSSPDSLRGGCIAAFAATSASSVVVVVAELQKGRSGNVHLRSICDGIRRAVWEEEGVKVGRVVLAESGGVPKTTSGKLRRGMAREMLAGELIPKVFEALYDDEDDKGAATCALGADNETQVCGGTSWVVGEEAGGEVAGVVAMASGSTMLLMLLIAAWRTTPVLSHAKPEPGLDYGPGMKKAPSAAAVSKGGKVHASNQAAADAAILLRAKEEMAKRMVKHIEIIINSVKIAIQLKAALLVKSAEFMSAMAGEVSVHLTKVAQAHAQVAAADCVAALKLQQEILKKASESCKAITNDVAATHKARQEMLKGVAHDLVKAAGDIALSMKTMAEVAAGVAGGVSIEGNIHFRAGVNARASAKAQAAAAAAAGAQVSGGAGGEAKASKSAAISAGGDAGAGADANAGAGGDAGVSGGISKSATVGGGAGGYAGGSTDAGAGVGGDAAVSGGAKIGGGVGGNVGGKADANIGAGISAGAKTGAGVGGSVGGSGKAGAGVGGDAGIYKGAEIGGGGDVAKTTEVGGGIGGNANAGIGGSVGFSKSATIGGAVGGNAGGSAGVGGGIGGNAGGSGGASAGAGIGANAGIGAGVGFSGGAKVGGGVGGSVGGSAGGSGGAGVVVGGNAGGSAKANVGSAGGSGGAGVVVGGNAGGSAKANVGAGIGANAGVGAGVGFSGGAKVGGGVGGGIGGNAGGSGNANAGAGIDANAGIGAGIGVSGGAKVGGGVGGNIGGSANGNAGTTADVGISKTAAVGGGVGGNVGGSGNANAGIGAAIGAGVSGGAKVGGGIGGNAGGSGNAYTGTGAGVSGGGGVAASGSGGANAGVGVSKSIGTGIGAGFGVSKSIGGGVGAGVGAQGGIGGQANVGGNAGVGGNAAASASGGGKANTEVAGSKSSGGGGDFGYGSSAKEL
nr:unnamed protein product [Digitaria exilis]